MIILLIKISVAVTFLLAFYKLFLEKESFFKANRIYLLSALIGSCILPFIAFPKIVEHQGLVATLLEQSKAEASVAKSNSTIEDAQDAFILTAPNLQEPHKKNHQNTETLTSPSSTISPTAELDQNHLPSSGSLTAQKSISFWILMIYFFGVVVLSINLIWQVVSTLWKVYKSNDKIEDTDAVIINMNSSIEPCSFFKYIFINPTIYDYETYEQILAHEKIHVNQLHTIDLLLSEVAIIFLWFNPIIWIFRKEVEKNLEYQTDDILIKGQSEEKEIYQMNLVKIASHIMPLSITTNYNQSLIKQRIIKMNSKKSNINTYWKYAFVAPVFFTITLILNKPIVGIAQEDISLAPPINQNQEAKIKDDENSDASDPNVAVLTTVTSTTSQTTFLDDNIKINNRTPENSEPQTTDDQLTTDNKSDCKKLLSAIRIQDIPKIKEYLKSIDSNCIDPEPEFDKIILANHTFWKQKSASPLFAAARDGNVEIGKLLIDAGSKISLKLEGEGTPLITACLYGQLDFAKLLIANGADINEYLPNEGNSLIAAASNGHTHIVEHLLSIGAELQFDSPNQGTALIAAANNGQSKTVEFLLSKGARIDYDSPNQGNALIAAANNGYKETSDLLLTKGASINYESPNQGNALIAAANNGQIETVTLLIDKGAEINYESPNQGNPLIAAANNGHIQTVKLLLSKGADINFTSSNQGTPLIAAANNGHLQTMTLLLDQGALINFESPNQGTALIAAANNGHSEVIEYLISKDIKIDHISPNQGTALIAAANNGHKEAIKILLSNGAQINKTSPNQGTAIIAAARNGHLRTVELLIESGADPDIQVHGHNALTAAISNGHQNTVDYLRKHGSR